MFAGRYTLASPVAIDPGMHMHTLVDKMHRIADLSIDYGGYEDRVQMLNTVHNTANYVLAVTADLRKPLPIQPTHHLPGGVLDSLSHHLRIEAIDLAQDMELVAQFVWKNQLTEDASDIHWRIGRMDSDISFKLGDAGEAQRRRLFFETHGLGRAMPIAASHPYGSRAA